MKRALLIVVFFGLFIVPKAQVQSLWFNSSQQYYKFPVVSDGWYRIPYSALVNAFGASLASIPSQQFALYHNGVEVCMFSSAAGTNSVGNQDYFGFYGQHNIGDLDSVLYRNGYSQPHPYYSLFNDTSYYYLTVKGSNSQGLRFSAISNNLSNPPAAEPYFIYASRQFFTAQTGQNLQGIGQYLSGEEVWSSIFDVGEGYADNSFIGVFPNNNPPQLQSKTYSFFTPNLYTGTGAPLPSLYAVFANYSPVGQNQDTDVHALSYNVNSSTVYSQAPVKGFHLVKITVPIPNGTITSSSTNVTVSAQSTAASSYEQNVIYLNEIDYPRTFNFQGLNFFRLQLPNNGNVLRYVEITNFASNGFQPTLFDLAQNQYYQSNQPVNSNPLEFVIGGDGSNTAKAHDLYLLSNDPSSYTTVNSLNPIVFLDYNSLLANCDYAIITDSSLMIDVDGNGVDEITDYAHHRDANYNPQTGKYHPAVFVMSQLYDQFAFGVKKSPLAIRNFIQYALSKYPNKLKFVFLVGKGLQYPEMRPANSASYAQCLVPSFGQPASDNLLAATRFNYAPTVAVGRLAANNATQVYAYRRKMTVYDSLQTYTYTPCMDIPDKLWQKQILHFSGGSDYTEQVIFAQYLANYGDTAQGLYWGANVTTFAKTGSAPISQTEAQVIQNDIDSGVSLVSFFGHASTGGFDFSINEPENYTNYNKYFVILSDGCFSGDIFETVPSPTTASYSERFVLEPNVGAIAFMATSGLSVSDGLDVMSSSLYDTFCKPEYYNALGISFQRMEDNIFNNPNYANEYNDSTGTYLGAFEMTLHGDPGLWLNQYPKPDYALAQHTGSSVYFTPAVITPGLDSFKVNVIVTNLGKAINQTIAVSVQRTITPIGQASVVLPAVKKYIKAPYYIDTVSFTMPVQASSVNVGQGTLGAGLNQFAVMLDADNVVNEMTKCNNGYTISTNIQSDDLQPIYPYEFAIDSDPGVVLKASTTNPFAANRTYDFQFDTSRTFNPNDGAFQHYSVTQVGGVLHWHPTLLNKDSVVYYWRVKIDTSNTWHYSSFVHISHMYGWQQSHFWQFTQNSYLTMKLDTTPSRMFQFDSTVNNITVTTGQANAASPPGPVDFENMGWNYNNVPMYRYRMGGCGFANGITFGVIDGNTGLPWVSINNNGDNYGDTYGNWQCSNQLDFQYGFDFSTTGAHLPGSIPWYQYIETFINAIPNGDFVILYSDNTAPYTQWDTSLVNTLSIQLGMPAQLFKSGHYTGPFIWFVKKGSGTQGLLTENNTYDSIATSINFMGAWYQGQMLSTVIGPAVKWGRMQWGRPSTEAPSVYKDSVDIFGISSAGSPVLLRTTSLYDNSIQNISPQQYPMMQLRFRTENDSIHKASQLQYWRVIYQKPPEVAVNPAAFYSLQNNQSVGGSVQLKLGIENVTKIRMDSVLVKYSLTNAANNNSSMQIRYGPMPGIDTLILNYNLPINNSGFQGTNQLALEVNPSGDHLEQFHFNNYANVTFTATADSLNPLLDVTFDGQHIFTGDIVSAKPDILITLHDNNKFLPLNDSSAISVYLLAPNSTTPVHINYDNQTLRFYPADSTQLNKANKCEAEFKPTLPVDGNYELLVRDADRSGNHSSNSNRVEDNTYYDYKIDFQVINKPMISNVLNYPNPFSTATKFLFTVTGSEVPDYMKIRIMTVRGVVVKEITKDEMGPLHVGTNITEYTWDGRDQYGSQLANGVYFYQVVTKENNENMTHLSESYDQYFKKGIGKLVILR